MHIHLITTTRRVSICRSIGDETDMSGHVLAHGALLVLYISKERVWTAHYQTWEAMRSGNLSWGHFTGLFDKV